MESATDPAWPLEAWTAELLAELRRYRYTPAAWASLFGASWDRSRATARREAGLVRSWRRLTLGLLAGSACPLAMAWWTGSARQARRMAMPLLAGLLWQQADAYVHLGINRRLRDGVLLPDLGPALWLSYLRGTTAHWLLSATLADIDLPGLGPCALLVGAVTDSLDGPLARGKDRATKLGAYADGEADIVLAVATAMAAVRRGSLPANIYWMIAARYALPLGVGFGLACARGRPPSLEHTLTGRLCGAAQAGLMGCALAPARWHGLATRPRRILLPLAVMLNVASGTTQAWRVLCASRHRG